jgi:DNA mismatch repair protein MutL
MTQGPIRKLSEGTINRIAAGEVIERPASAVKELVENAIDAGATQIDVVFRGGGKTLIRVSDNGSGMEPDDLQLAIERHCTSKLPDDEIFSIRTMGFRGEALPSIASVSRMAIVSRRSGLAHELKLEAGRAGPIAPAARQRGTDVEVRDLFFATPARLKFLKTDRGETSEALDVVRRLALTNSAIGFSFTTEDRTWLEVPASESQESRIARVIGEDFIANATPVSLSGEDISVEGWACHPTFARAQATHQYAFVNGRPVRDKLIAGAIRGAYADVLPRGRHPVVVLYISCAASRVDVNVHPAKTEVRFRDQGFVRSLIVSAIKRALAQRPMKADQNLATATLSSFRSQGYRPISPGFAETQAAFDMNAPLAPLAEPQDVAPGFPLGAARAQLHNTYIVAQTERGMILVDQHAAHERIVYERLKAARRSTGIRSQRLLVPQVIDLDSGTQAAVLVHSELLGEAGLSLEAFGDGAVIVREVPADIAGGDIPGLLRDIADDSRELESTSTVDERINLVLATFACHHSVRSGRILRADEMNALLREMERTPNAGECNHGRPTFIELSLADIERLFGRT